MASFQDTFGRNNKDGDLQYDDAASYFFFAGVLSLVVVPLFIHVVRSVLKGPSFDLKRIKCNWRKDLNLKEFKARKYSGFLYFKVNHF